ncbi:MAG: EAL domain-containing protein [Flexilinea sp.]|nr:EAL domain-containing protein [Flexilinea sp.]
MVRQAFSVIYIFLIAALVVCYYFTHRSHKAISSSVGLMLLALIPPVIGNMMIISTSDLVTARIGYYIYFLGMNASMYALLKFTLAYCNLDWPNQTLKRVVYGLLILDTLQYAFNPFFHQAFSTEPIMVDGRVYHSLIAYAGQAFHRIVDYGIFISVILIFFVKTVRTPRIYRERYSTLLITMVIVGAWETFYIFSKSPIDRSMIGFGVFGLVVFYFSLYYRPMRLLDRMLANIASDMPDALFFFDAAGRCIWANPPGIKLMDIENEDFEPVGDRLIEKFDLPDLRGGESMMRTRRNIGTGRKERHYVIEKHEVTDKNRVTGFFVTIRDDTAEQRAMEHQVYIANHDNLTGLYTREYLYRRIKQTLHANSSVDYCVVFLDANNFKVVNDIYGNEFGDFALTFIADWVRAHFPSSSIYGRISGDMFGALMPVADFDADYLERELTNFKIREGKVDHPLLMHLGVYKITEPGLDVSVMFDRARMALTTIKNEFQTHIAYYDDDMREKVLWDQMISTQLSEALATKQVQPYLQPVVDVNGNVVGAEALVRWKHPIDGLLSPGSFIPVFERNGMIAEVDRYMWRSACEILSRWKKAGRDDLFISVNISPKDFYFMDVAAEVESVVNEYGIDPGRLRVEITETAMMDDIDNRVQILNDLQRHGFMVEMDDFGSGYSSLNMLKDMPVEVIKLDMVFLKKSHNEVKARKILNHIVKLSEDLGVTSLTEGVETVDQYEMLVGMGCKLFQGYYFAKPMPVEEFEIFSQTRRK